MEGMITACVEGEPVRWRVRQQQEEFRYLVQNIQIWLSCHTFLPGQNIPVNPVTRQYWINYQLVDGAVLINLSVIRMNWLASKHNLKMVGRSFGWKKNYGLTVTVSFEPWWEVRGGAKSAKLPKIATIRKNSSDAHTTDTNKQHVKEKTTTPKRRRVTRINTLRNSDV